MSDPLNQAKEIIDMKLAKTDRINTLMRLSSNVEYADVRSADMQAVADNPDATLMEQVRALKEGVSFLVGAAARLAPVAVKVGAWPEGPERLFGEWAQSIPFGEATEDDLNENLSACVAGLALLMPACAMFVDRLASEETKP